MRSIIRGFLSVALLAASLPALAHKPSDAYLRLTVHGNTLEQRFDIALRDLDRELQLDANDDGELLWGELRPRIAEVQAYAEAGLDTSLKDQRGAACTLSAFAPMQIDKHSDGNYAVLVRRWQCAAPPQDLMLSYRLFATSDPTHRGVTLLSVGERRQTLVLVPNGTAQHLNLSPNASSDGARADLLSILLEGVHHIWVGYDHILFLLSLLLPAVLIRTLMSWSAAPRLKPVLVEVLSVVTAFTAAHSITLALAAFDIVNPPSRLVESLIALSVLLAALNNLWPVLKSGRWKLTFAFGLIHGFGFASALKDLGLSKAALAGPLLMFNLGVEVGQLTIVAVFVPIAWSLRKKSWYPRWVLGVGSVLIAVLALAWLVERMFDLKFLPI